MDSARSYHTSKTSVRRFEITDYQAGLTDVSTKGQKTPEGEDTAQNTGEQENTAENSAENTAMTAKDWQSRFLVSSARWNMRSSASEQTLSTIREYTVRYIFDLLFPSRNSTLHDWMQENGWSGGTQETVTATPTSDVFPQVTSRVKVLNYVGESWSIEQEDTSFSTVGTVRTKDGREINFNVNVNMSRRCEEYYREELNVAQFALYDPLVIRIAACFAIIISFIPKVSAIISTMPASIIGGVSFMLYGMISAIGVRNVVENKVDLTKSRNLIIAGVIFVCGLGFSNGLSFTIGGTTVTLTALAIAAIAGILLNMILPGNDYEFGVNETGDENRGIHA